MRSKTIKGVLHNFLGTHTSRNSDYDGYWLIGMLVRDFHELEIDLLASNPSAGSDSLFAFAVDIARRTIRVQMRKAGLQLERVQEAELSITKLSDTKSRWINSRESIGNTFRFVAKVKVNTGKKYERETAIVVAPHDPEVEKRSVRPLIDANPSTDSG